MPQPTDKTPGILYLIPSALADGMENVIPAYVMKIVEGLSFFVVENERSARRYLRKIGYKNNFDEVTLIEIDKHNPNEINQQVFVHLKAGGNAGILSEAGLPAVADPGNLYVQLAHSEGIKVSPLTGPSSILLALMASGMNGQRFRFHGYIPVAKAERIKKIQEMERLAGKEDETQIFIETPYRNQSLFDDIIHTCSPQTLLCIAADLTAQTELIKTMPVRDWQKKTIDINKRPAVFLIYK